MQPITAIIPCLNEEANIAEAIASVSWCDHILVIDSLSTDNTVQIAKRAGVTVIERAFDGYANQKNWAISKSETEWVFVMDADERATDELKTEMQAILSQDSISESGFWIYRANIFMGRRLKYIWRTDKVIRLIKKSECRYAQLRVHEEIETEGAVGKLNAKLLHDTYTTRGFSEHLAKGERYSTYAAIDKADSVGRVGLYHLAVRPFITFIKLYIFHLGFLDGRQGFIISCLSAWNVFSRFVKIWRIKEGERIG